MSYILDALRKSEQERHRGAIPDLGTVQAQARKGTGAGRFWPVWLAAALLAVNGALVWYVVIKEAPPPQAPIVAAVPNAMPIRDAIPIEASRWPVPQQGAGGYSRQYSTPKNISLDSAPVPDHLVESEPVGQPADYVPFLVEMPAEFQSEIPTISFSSHMYSGDPSRRSVIINGRYLKERQALGGELMVAEITSDGVVFSRKGVLFKIGVLEEWSNF